MIPSLIYFCFVYNGVAVAAPDFPRHLELALFLRDAPSTVRLSNKDVSIRLPPGIIQPPVSTAN